MMFPALIRSALVGFDPTPRGVAPSILDRVAAECCKIMLEEAELGLAFGSRCLASTLRLRASLEAKS